MHSSTIIAATFAALAAAAPTARQSADKFILITAHSGNQDVHLRGVVENGLKLWIGKDTVSDCPAAVGAGCEGTGNGTQFIAAPGTPYVSMDAIVPGGQELYVATDGSLSALAPHVHDTKGGSDTPFQYTSETETNNGKLQYNGQDFTACVSGDARQIFALGYAGFTADPAADCIAVNLVAFKSKQPSVWEYR